jgi:hypothetical protein
MSLIPSRRGAWIVNTSKHLINYKPTDIGLDHLDNILFAGKCGSLLIKLSADKTEQLNNLRVKAYARFCGISKQELPTYLKTLKAHGCLDWDQDGDTYEVLAFSRQRVLATTSDILEALSLESLESAVPDLLEFCLLRPRLLSEVKNYLSNILSEQDADHLIGLVSAFELLGSIDSSNQSEKLYFNGYQFGDRAVEIGKALAVLSDEGREELNFALEKIADRPGTPLSSLNVSEATERLAIGLGLIEVSEVVSPVGTEKFLTTARLAPPSVGRETEHLEDDVFHHAKMLLSSFRFGQLRSLSSRGKIWDDPTFLVNAMLNKGHIGPCTAIGQDYVILEAEGIIRTTPARDRSGEQFYMELRRREPAEIVLDLFESGTSDTLDASVLPRSLELPPSYTGPEIPRAAASKRAVVHDKETTRAFLEELRT